MKTFRLIGMAFIAVFMCLTACSSEDEGNWTNRGIDKDCIVVDNMAFRIYDAESYGEDYAEIVSYVVGLTNLDIPSKVYNKKTEKSYDVKYIDKNLTAFEYSGDENLLSVKMPNTIVGIYKWAFTETPNLKSVILSENLQLLEAETFNGCSSLSSIKIPGSLEFIGKYAFSGCRSLVNVELSEGLIGINESAFSDCPLTSITIPSSVKNIFVGAFGSCPLQKITIKGTPYLYSGAFNINKCKEIFCYSPTPPKIGDYSSFGGNPDLVTVYVPKGCIKNYERSEWGKFFSNIIEMEF